MDQEEPTESWRDIVRENNEPGVPNILLTLEDVQAELNQNPDAYNKALVFLYKNDGRGDSINSAWFNAGFRFSEIIFLLEYMKQIFIQEMNGSTEEHPRE